ncbi:protein adenylyltransferase SelO [Candidatus Pelagibacter sp.]|uniref:protein adenylyltransferase SelO n=1 Tax=Candidatus Pelagibacter sp. TaxID=2024849 RepID=UPI003F85954E
MTIGWHFDNSYYKLPKLFREEINPVPVKKPGLVIFNENLAKDLDLDFSKSSEEEISNIFSGNNLPKGSNSIAQAYAGHQFGHFTMLGDGRAVLLGEHISNSNERFDIQLKGSGRTSFSRGGDGRAALGPMLREYIISEAMYGLNIPTTRSLAVVTTGENVIRGEKLPGAVLTRVASSHIRVGTFQYIAARQKIDELETLINYVINRHYPYINNTNKKASELLKVLMEKQIELVVNWMRVGFIHGVMNTDNMSISGESIDYGPCAFMDIYDPNTVFSSIDQFGRYSFSNQPKIIKWNLLRFAECLIPLLDKNENKAIDKATNIINEFEKIYEHRWLNMMRDKLGLFGINNDDKKLISDLLKIMFDEKLDYTKTFSYLMGIKLKNENSFQNKRFLSWKKEWLKRLNSQTKPSSDQLNLMKKNNPLIIPRNYHVEKALTNASEGNLDYLKELLAGIQRPYEYDNESTIFFSSVKIDKNYKTFCGT